MEDKALIAALIGVSVGILTILAARAIRREPRLYAIGLLTLPSLYAFFALRVGDRSAAVEEVMYGLPYYVAGILFAFVRTRYSAVVIGSMWILHGVYDLVHSGFVSNAGVPDWYPAFCFSVDVVIGAYVLLRSRHLLDSGATAGP